LTNRLYATAVGWWRTWVVSDWSAKQANWWLKLTEIGATGP